MLNNAYFFVSKLFILQKFIDILTFLKHVIIVIFPEANRIKVTHMYETVLNHTYYGKLLKKSEAKGQNVSGKWTWAKTTHLVYTIDGDDPIIITNIPGNEGNHAEEQLMELFLPEKFMEISLHKREVVEQTKLVLYINNSPCSQRPHNCTRKLIEMLDTNENVHLILYVASLYNICRESCETEYHNEFIDTDDHKNNYRGLRNLMKHERCEVNSFNEDVWKELFKMTTGSDQLPGNYDEITEGNERSRKDEDERIGKDLKHIRRNSL